MTVEGSLQDMLGKVKNIIKLEYKKEIKEELGRRIIVKIIAKLFEKLNINYKPTESGSSSNPIRINPKRTR